MLLGFIKKVHCPRAVQKVDHVNTAQTSSYSGTTCMPAWTARTVSLCNCCNDWLYQPPFYFYWYI